MQIHGLKLLFERSACFGTHNLKQAERMKYTVHGQLFTEIVRYQVDAFVCSLEKMKV
jgi:hypothetical protein